MAAGALVRRSFGVSNDATHLFLLLLSFDSHFIPRLHPVLPLSVLPPSSLPHPYVLPPTPSRVASLPHSYGFPCLHLVLPLSSLLHSSAVSRCGAWATTRVGEREVVVGATAASVIAKGTG